MANAAKPFVVKSPQQQRADRRRHTKTLSEKVGSLRPLGDPPSTFTEAQSKWWAWLKAEAVPQPQEMDRVTAMQFCIYADKLDSGELGVSESQVLRSITRDYGMDPGSKSKIRMPSEVDKPKFDLDADA